MAGTMAFYNGMMPGISKMVESMAGDAAAQKGYQRAALAESEIASARKANTEAALKQREYRDAAEGSLNYVLGKHGLNAGDFNRFVEHVNGRGDPGVQFSPEDVVRYNAALTDYGALRRGGEQHLGSYILNSAKAPGEQAESRIKTRMADSFETGQGYGPHKTWADLIAAGNTALGRGNEATAMPTSVREAQWLASASPQDKAQWEAVQRAKQSPGAVVQNFAASTETVRDPKTGKPMLIRFGKDNSQYPVGEAYIKGEDSKVPLSPLGKMMSDIQNGYIKGGKGPTTSGW